MPSLKEENNSMYVFVCVCGVFRAHSEEEIIDIVRPPH